MISTYTSEFRTQYVQSFLGYNLVAFLIYKPTLGITDTPTPTELAARRALTMITAAASEVTLGNGYSRYICTLTPVTTSDPAKTLYTAQGSFTATGGAIGPVTHICYCRSADLAGASTGNGNNRGSSVGTLIKVEPLLLAPTTIASGVTFLHTTNFEFYTQATA